jgi:glycosyltransferase involved in cell wall biosynthesis
VRILLITVYPPSNVPEGDHALHLAEHLAGRGLDVHVLAQEGAVAATRPGITVYPFMHDWSFSDLPHLVACLLRCSPDAVVLMYVDWAFNYHPMVTFLPTFAKTLVPRTHVMVYFGNVGMDPLAQRNRVLPLAVRAQVARWLGPALVDGDCGTLISQSDSIVVVSHQQWDLLSAHYPAVKHKTAVAVLPAPPILRLAPAKDGETRRHGRRLLGLNPDEFALVYFGYLYRSKGVETLLHAFQLARGRLGNLRLILVGGSLDFDSNLPSYTAELRGLAEQLGIDGKLTWTGAYRWDSDEASVYLWAADACVLPFDWGVELRNTSLGTAATHGLPVITTRGAVLEEPFVDRGNVVLCPPREPAALAAAIETVATEPELRARLRAGALELARQWYSWDRAVDRLLGLIRPPAETPVASPSPTGTAAAPGDP